MIVKTININDILPNPYRNFDNYPLDEAQVQRLMVSLNKRDLWHPLPARRLGNAAQLAFGHHRLEAMKRLGKTDVRLSFNDLSEDDMVQMMVEENATQRGNSVVAALDSMAAIVTRLASLLIQADDRKHLESLVGNVGADQRLFVDDGEFSRTKSLLMSGNGLGARVVSRYIGDGVFSDPQIVETTTQLKQTGQLRTIVDNVAKAFAVEQEAARLEAERIERESREAEAEERRRIEEEADRKRRQVEAREARAIKIAKDRAAREAARAEAQALREKLEANKRAEERRAIAARQAADKRAEEARAEERKKKAQAEAARLAAQEQAEKTIDVKAVSLFKVPTYAMAFRRAMAKPEAQAVFAQDQHVAVAEAIIANQGGEDNLTEKLVQLTVENFVRFGKIQIKNHKKAAVDKEAANAKHNAKERFRVRYREFQANYDTFLESADKMFKFLSDNPGSIDATTAMDLRDYQIVPLIKKLIAIDKALQVEKIPYVTREGFEHYDRADLIEDNGVLDV